MNFHTELGQLEQALLQLAGRAVEVEREVRKRVQDVQLVLGGTPGFSTVPVVERGDLAEHGLPFGLKLVVALPQTLHERVIRVGVLSLAEHVLLPTGQVSGAPLQAGALLGAFRVGPLLSAIHVPRQQRAPLRVEQELAERLVDHRGDRFFPDVDRAGMASVFVGAAAVVVGRPAPVVGVPELVAVALHPATTVADHPTAVPVRALGVPMHVRIGAIA